MTNKSFYIIKVLVRSKKTANGTVIPSTKAYVSNVVAENTREARKAAVSILEKTESLKKEDIIWTDVEMFFSRVYVA